MAACSEFDYMRFGDGWLVFHDGTDTGIGMIWPRPRDARGDDIKYYVASDGRNTEEKARNEDGTAMHFDTKCDAANYLLSVYTG